MSYVEYSKSRIVIEKVLNDVQVKPEESIHYIDKELQKGEIIGVNCEFGINDKEHIELIESIQNADSKADSKGEEEEDADFYKTLQEIKDKLDVEGAKEENVDKFEELLLSLKPVKPEHANVTTVFFERSFGIKGGERICICGGEDDGKSMFLFSLLCESELTNGTFKFNGNMGYLSMKRGAFVSGTVRDNITLFTQFKKQKYDKAVEISRLNWTRMPGDDFMQVSDGGNNLFQKEKVQILLARLVYLDPDIY